MEVMNLSKPFSVDVYSDFRRGKSSPWVSIGEFGKLDDAIEACKKVVDDFLQSPINAFIDSERLETAFLRYGDVPAINGAENLPSFDIYAYLAMRCREVSHRYRSDSIQI
jgi:hypothetical protein